MLSDLVDWSCWKVAAKSMYREQNWLIVDLGCNESSSVHCERRRGQKFGCRKVRCKKVKRGPGLGSSMNGKKNR